MFPIGLLYSQNANMYGEGFNKDSLLINSCYNIDNQNVKCNNCINQYELLNLYVDGLIILEDLRKIKEKYKND